MFDPDRQRWSLYLLLGSIPLLAVLTYAASNVGGHAAAAAAATAAYAAVTLNCVNVGGA